MSKITGVLAILLLLCFGASAQIEKGRYLLGGNGSFVKHANTIQGSVRSKDTRLSLMTNFGYFFFNRFAAGIALNYDRNSLKYIGAAGTERVSSRAVLATGPFVRYYFLDTSARVNVLAGIRANWQYGNYKANGNSPGPKLDLYESEIFAGPAVFFNQYVSVELLLGYARQKQANYELTANGIRANLGIQLHLK